METFDLAGDRGEGKLGQKLSIEANVGVPYSK